MNFEEHLVLGWGFTLVLLVFAYLSGVNVFEAHNIPYLIVGVSVFSVLPDIDHSRSKASRFLSIGLITLTFFSFINYYNNNSVFELVKAGFWSLVFMIHKSYAQSSKRHRRFPHTFTFGILSSAVMLLISGSSVIMLACFTAFFSHLLADTHLRRAFRNDLHLWKKIIRY